MIVNKIHKETRATLKVDFHRFAMVALLFVYAVHPTCAQGQGPVYNGLVAPLYRAAENRALETVYIQSSKGTYETGEDLWFKGIVLNSRYLTPSLKAKTLYVQLIEDKTNIAVREDKYEVTIGFVDGHLYLQDTLRAGNYTLAAYTPCSLYDDGKPITSVRKLHIVKNIADSQNDFQDTLTVSKVPEGKTDFQLFPEGGHLVAGIQSKLAFKSVDEKGMPKAVSGTLFANGKPLVNFKSSHNGTGSFGFVPNLNTRYHITLDSMKTGAQYPLPEIQPKGYVLHLAGNTKEALSFTVSQNLTDTRETIYLRIQIRGIVYNIAKTELEKTKQIAIPLKGLPQGIAEVALFNKDMQPLAERLVYVNPDQKLNIQATLNKEEYLAKEKAALKIKVTDRYGKPVVAHLGLSVFDAVYENPNDDKTLETHCFLSAQLKGNIYGPSYYFDAKNRDRQQALDLLMLTQGWRAYVWAEDNLRQETLKTQPIIKDVVTGKVYAKKKKDNAVLGKQMVMAFTAEQKGTSLLEIDSMGNFKVLPEIVQRAKNGYLYLKLLNREFAITVNDPSFERVNKLRKDRAMAYPVAGQKAERPIGDRPFPSADGTNVLDEVLLTGKKKKVFRDKYMGKLDSLAKLQMGFGDYVCIYKVLNCEEHKDDPNNTRPIEGKEYTEYENFEWVDKVGGPYTFTSISRITYKYPELTEAELLERFNLAVVKGYHGKKKFYEPVYDALEQTDGIPDYRNTLYWKPNIVTNEQGEASIDFYCSDLNTRFKGVVEGVSGDGKLGRQTFEFRVQKRK